MQVVNFRLLYWNHCLYFPNVYHACVVWKIVLYQSMWQGLLSQSRYIFYNRVYVIIILYFIILSITCPLSLLREVYVEVDQGSEEVVADGGEAPAQLVYDDAGQEKAQFLERGEHLAPDCDHRSAPHPSPPQDPVQNPTSFSPHFPSTTLASVYFPGELRTLRTNSLCESDWIHFDSVYDEIR